MTAASDSSVCGLIADVLRRSDIDRSREREPDLSGMLSRSRLESYDPSRIKLGKRPQTTPSELRGSLRLSQSDQQQRSHNEHRL